MINIFSNYIPNKYIIIDDKDPPWMTKAIKDKINTKKSLCESKKFIELQSLAIDISEMISIRKDEHYDISQRNIIPTLVRKPTGQF